MRVGDYVRTRKGYIAKYKGIEKCNNIDGESEDWFIFDSTIIDDYGNSVPVEINKSYFIKSSPNIIDLIEAGDICTFEVTDIDNYEYYIGKHTDLITQEGLDNFKDMILMESAKLISIVTKEQFESMEYRIGE